MIPPRISPKEALILDLLRRGGEAYGLELVKASAGALKRGTIYVTLDRMGDKGLVASRAEKVEGEAGMARRYYRITGEGQAVLRGLDAYREAKEWEGWVS